MKFEFDDPFEVELMLKCAIENPGWINERFPAEGACLCHFSPIVTLDKKVFGGQQGGLIQELITLIGWALEGKETYQFEEMFV